MRVLALGSVPARVVALRSHGARIFTLHGIFTPIVKKPIALNIAQDLEAEALRILRAIPDIDVAAESRSPGGRRADAVVRHADNDTEISIEVKRRVDVATAHRMVHFAREEPGLPLLLVAGETTAGAREVLGDAGIAYVDGLGNARMELPGLILRLTGTRKPSPTRAPSKLSGKSGLVAQTLLLDHDRDWHVKDVVETVDASAGLVHRVMARLEKAGLLAATGTGPKRTRRVTNPSALLDLWDEEQTDIPVRTLAYFLSQTPRQLIEALGGMLENSGIDHAFTGAAGASVVAPFVTSVPVAEIWVDAATPEAALIDPPAMTRVEEGPNVIYLQERDNAPLAFRTNVDGIWVTNRFRLYHDLRQDPRRGASQADHLREQVIGF